MKKGILVRSLCLVFLTLSVICFVPHSSQGFMAENNVRIGNVSPLTGPGGSYAFQAFSGMKLAVEWINKSMGGVMINGMLVPIKIIPPDGYDTGTNTGQAIALASKLGEQDQVLAVVHSLTSGETDALYKAMANKNIEVPTIANLSSAGNVASYTPWGFRYSINEPQQLKKIIKLLHDKFNINTAVLVLEKDSRYANMTADHGFVPGCKAAGVKIKETVTVLSKDKDFSSQAAKLRSANADMIMVSTFAASGAYVIKEAYRRGVKPKVVLGCNGTNSPEYIKIAGKAAEGTIMRSGYNDKLPGAAEVAAEFKERFKGKKENGDKFNLDLRVAKVIEVEDHPDADKLYIIKLDLGDEKRQIVASIKPFYKKKELEGKNIVIVANLKPAKFKGEVSNGMLLAAEVDDDCVLVFSSLKPGDQITYTSDVNKEQIAFDDFMKVKLIVKDKKVLADNNVLEGTSCDVKDGSQVR